MTDLLHRTRVALALDRTPGFNYSCNLLGVRFPQKSPARVEVVMDHGPYCEDPGGEVNLGAVSMMADVAMGSVIRANLAPEQRLATVSLSLQFTGAPLIGPITGEGEFANFVMGADSRQGLCRCSLSAAGSTVLYGSGAFMVMEPPPGRVMHPVVDAIHEDALPLKPEELEAHEPEVFARSMRALQAAGGERGFLQQFWGMLPTRTADGAECRAQNGPHLGNRVGHMQGGLQVGMALVTAAAALPATWQISGVSAWFLRPGEGEEIVTNARVEHRGRNTAVVRTVLTGHNGQRVLEAVSTHFRRG